MEYYLLQLCNLDLLSDFLTQWNQFPWNKRLNVEFQYSQPEYLADYSFHPELSESNIHQYYKQSVS